VVTENRANNGDWESIMDSIADMNAPVIPIENRPVTVDVAVASPSVKGMTKLISIGMFREGKTIEAIAAERGLTTGTIIGHLTEWIETGEIDIIVFVSAENLPIIIETIKNNPDPTLGQIKTLLGDDYTYPEIKATFSYLKFLNSKTTETASAETEEN